MFGGLLAIAIVTAACGGGATAPSGGGGPSGSCYPVTGRCPSEAQQLTGAGSTFAAVIYTKWTDEYGKLTGVQINYQSVGSGAGIKSLTDRTVDYGATDGPMTDAQLAAAKAPVLHLPMVMGGVVPTYNLPGISATLRFTPEALAGIYLGRITRWNDPALASVNPDVRLPDQPITTVHRSDGSGTTYTWTDYLSKVSPDWKAKVGVGTSVNWPNGLGGKGNEGVAGVVKQTPYAIGYVEIIYAVQQKLGYGWVRNAAGRFVEPTLDSVSKAAAGITLPDDLRVSITNSENPDAYPISTFTWTLSYTEIADHAKALAIARYLWWSIHEGQAFAKDLGYAPLPADVVAKTSAKIRSITSGGTPVLPQ
jgi:phosphate transport system substrate-binding protein